jgi:hypothetical protein
MWCGAKVAYFALLCKCFVVFFTQKSQNKMEKKIDLDEVSSVESSHQTTDSRSNDEMAEQKPTFDSGIFSHLPFILKRSCNILQEKTAKDVFLLSALSCISSVLTQYTTIYDGRVYYSNLNAYIVGLSGSGKGAMDYAQDLMKKIDEERRKEQAAKDKVKRLFIPIDITATLFKQMLQDNEGIGLLYENEGTTLANAFKSDYGDYSDVFRKSFAHETIRCARKGESIDITIPKPKLSVCISSTFGQLTLAVPDAEDGTFSRFAFYETPNELESLDFYNVFAPNKKDYHKTFEIFATELYYFYEKMQKGHYEFSLSNLQQTKLVDYFISEKRQILQILGTDINGTINRLAIILVRIAMILTILRRYEDKKLDTQQLICSDLDFDIAFKIFEVLKQHAITIFLRLPKNKKLGNADSAYKTQIKSLYASGRFKTQTELAKFLHVGQAYVSQVLSGKK